MCCGMGGMSGKGWFGSTSGAYWQREQEREDLELKREREREREREQALEPMRAENREHAPSPAPMADYSPQRRIRRTIDPRLLEGGSWSRGEIGDARNITAVNGKPCVAVEVKYPHSVFIAESPNGSYFRVRVLFPGLHGKTSTGDRVEFRGEYVLRPGEYIEFEGGARLDFASDAVPFAELETQEVAPVAQVAPAPRVVAPREAPATVLPSPEVQKADAAARKREQVERERAAAEAADLDAVMDAALARVATPLVTQRVVGKTGVR